MGIVGITTISNKLVLHLQLIIVSVIITNNILVMITSSLHVVLAPHHAERLHDVAPSSASPTRPPSTAS
jgi:hypothetical protein